MKKMFFLIAAFVVSMAATAQTDTTMHKTTHAKMQHSTKDCVMMKDGKMMMMKNGKMMDMDKDMTMSDGPCV